MTTANFTTFSVSDIILLYFYPHKWLRNSAESYMQFIFILQYLNPSFSCLQKP